MLVGVHQPHNYHALMSTRQNPICQVIYIRPVYSQTDYKRTSWVTNWVANTVPGLCLCIGSDAIKFLAMISGYIVHLFTS